MSQFYSDPKRERDPHALPDCETVYLTAEEVAERDEEVIWKYSKRHEFRLHSMNSSVRRKMLETIVEEEGIEGGWFYWYCFPGCMPEGDPIGPYKTEEAAIAACREEAGTDEEEEEFSYPESMTMKQWKAELKRIYTAMTEAVDGEDQDALDEEAAKLQKLVKVNTVD